MNDFSSRLSAVQHDLSVAAEKAGRSPESVTLIAVTKTHPVETVEQALRSGILNLGENKVQEAASKIESLGRGIWHLIGHLQTNKVRDAVRFFDWIDSVDRLDLAQEIDRRAEPLGKIQNVLLQVNVAREGAKFGCAPEEAAALAEAINALPRLALGGLMTIPPFTDDPEKTRPHFAALRQLREELEKNTGLLLPILSMGMSGDYTVAVEEGATQVRVGTALFGSRRTQQQRRPEDPAFLEST